MTTIIPDQPPSRRTESGMHTRAVNAAAGVLLAAMQQGRQTSTGLAIALDSARLLNSPEHAAELERLRARLDVVHRVPQDNVTPAEVRLGQYARPPRTFASDTERALFQIACGLRDTLEEVRDQRNAARLKVMGLEARLAEHERPADTYPSALPWARLMDAEDLAEFLADVEHAIATVGATPTEALAAVEEACGTWRLIAEAQHAHNTAPGPDAEELRSCCAGPVCTCTPSSPQDDEYIPPREDRPGMRHAVRTEDADPARCLKVHPFSPRDGWRMVCGNCDHGKDASCHEDGDR